MKNDLEIVPFDFNSPAHTEALVNLMNEYISDKMGDGVPYLPEQKQLLVEGLKKHPSTLIVLARAGDSFVGLTTCFVNFATFTVKPFINVHDVIVTQSWRNRGVGRRMLEKVIELADESGCSKVTLEVREDNLNAKHLYNSLGFLDAVPRVYYLTKYL
jgi:ribosomal protein S18 acetylase RimI-like enzyme